MKKILIAALGFSFLTMGVAQAQDSDDNMILNWSFDEIDGKLRKPEQLEMAKYWGSGTAVGADLYQKGSKNELISWPDNQYGRQKTEEGNSYAGFVAYAYQNKVPRSYPTTEMASSMKAGGKYCVKFRISLSDLSKYGVNNIGVHFSKKEVGMDNENHLLFDTHVTKKGNPIMTEMDEWVLVCGVYEAKGGEKYMTIGNFTENEKTEYKKLKRPKGFTSMQKAIAYYYIEEVSVVMIDAYDECECEKKNPYAQQVSIVYSSQVISEANLTPEQIVDNVNVYFGLMKDKIEAAGTRDLNILAKTLAANPEMKLTVQAHIDIREKEKIDETGFYKDLAKRRADKVIAYLTGKGIAADRLTVELLEETKPVDTSGTEIGKAKNRRVEFILKK